MITVASWNVNSVRARFEVIHAWLAERRPDIVLLQETKVEDRQFPRELFEDQGYNLAVFGQKTYNGVAIASKFPIEDVVRKHFGENDDARYIEAFTGGVRIASVYVPNGQSIDSPQFTYKKHFFERLKTHIAQYLDDDTPFLVAGDFNVAPYDNDIGHVDTWRGNILCSSEERSWVRDILYAGWTDPMARAVGAEKNALTWWDYRGHAFARGDGLRIDYFLLSPRAADLWREDGVDRVWREREKTSDHAPIWGHLLGRVAHG